MQVAKVGLSPAPLELVREGGGTILQQRLKSSHLDPLTVKLHPLRRDTGTLSGPVPQMQQPGWKT